MPSAPLRAALPRNQPTLPLCVDLDGTLARTDLLWESLLSILRSRPALLWRLPIWLLRGRARFKQEVCGNGRIDVSLLPYHPELLEFLCTEAEAGRQLILLTGAHPELAEKVARHLGLFSEVISGGADLNLVGTAKANAATSRFGRGGFDYVGNSLDDLPVWRQAALAYAVEPEGGVLRALTPSREVTRIFSRNASWPATIFRAMRVSHWTKNSLVFVPALASHRISEPAVFTGALLTALAFSLLASSVYLLNDLIDLESDRAHSQKKSRPLASGALPIPGAIGMIFALLALSLVIGCALSPAVLITLIGYLLLTLAYTFSLKKQVILDVVILTMFYSLRLVAGSQGTGIPLSFWIICFSQFFFLSLSLLKRTVELRKEVNEPFRLNNRRGYVKQDAEILRTLGVSSGMIAVLVFGLYLNSLNVIALYAHAERLWLFFPLLIHWTARLWLQFGRNEVDADPLVHALRDRWTYAYCGLTAALMYWAT